MFPWLRSRPSDPIRRPQIRLGRRGSIMMRFVYNRFNLHRDRGWPRLAFTPRLGQAPRLRSGLIKSAAAPISPFAGRISIRTALRSLSSADQLLIDRASILDSRRDVRPLAVSVFRPSASSGQRVLSSRVAGFGAIRRCVGNHLHQRAAVRPPHRLTRRRRDMRTAVRDPDLAQSAISSTRRIPPLPGPCVNLERLRSPFPPPRRDMAYINPAS